ncbi:hypothetical protein T265_15492, partial [Opisthorchis viverrini]
MNEAEKTPQFCELKRVVANIFDRISATKICRLDPLRQEFCHHYDIVTSTGRHRKEPIISTDHSWPNSDTGVRSMQWFDPSHPRSSAGTVHSTPHSPSTHFSSSTNWNSRSSANPSGQVDLHPWNKVHRKFVFFQPWCPAHKLPARMHGGPLEGFVIGFNTKSLSNQ